MEIAMHPEGTLSRLKAAHDDFCHCLHQLKRSATRLPPVAATGTSSWLASFATWRPTKSFWPIWSKGQKLR